MPIEITEVFYPKIRQEWRQWLVKRIDQQKRVESILDEYIGLGEGYWLTDAQAYVEELRSEEEQSLRE